MGTVMVMAIPVLANARSICGSASKSLTRLMMVELSRNRATCSGGGRLSATVP